MADKSKNIIKDSKITDFTLRYQTIKNLPSKELEQLLTQEKNKERNFNCFFCS